MTVINPSLDASSLFSKSQVYIERGLIAKDTNNMEVYQLWASLAIELLAKSSLSHVHPALVADPTHVESLFAACGKQISPDVKTITAKTLFERLSTLLPSFDQRCKHFCVQLALRRNSELHSGESPFSGMNADTWEGQFWYAAELLLVYQDKNLDDWLGAKEANAPKRILAQAESSLTLIVKEKLKHAKKDFSKEAPNASAKKAKMKSSIDFSKNQFAEKFAYDLDIVERIKCPACSCLGGLGGELIDEEVDSSIDNDDPFIENLVQTYSSEEFLCLICNLHLKGKRELNEVEIEDTFTRITEREREFEPDYGND
ncbi:MAG: hypothetical protein BroJett040_23500 [Oligoflexia bacterium]|nr:MAG: hypothetical protein BroJett040_23500 [Oligoflexia bacterium]